MHLREQILERENTAVQRQLGEQRVRNIPADAKIRAGEGGGAPGCGAVRCGEEPTQEQGIWRELPLYGRHMLEQFSPDGWTPWYRPLLEQFLKSCWL